MPFRVLVVDDAADIRMLMEAVLSRAGFEVLQASGGAEALDMLEAGAAPDVVLLDVQMPDMDGWETLAAVRADPMLTDIAVVVCTVKGRGEDGDRARDLGADGYVSKPFTLSELVDQVAMAARKVTHR